jgi:multisubunit Na+/H+ antiporter MnhC subunit
MLNHVPATYRPTDDPTEARPLHPAATVAALVIIVAALVLAVLLGVQSYQPEEVDSDQLRRDLVELSDH